MSHSEAIKDLGSNVLHFIPSLLYTLGNKVTKLTYRAFPAILGKGPWPKLGKND